MKLLDSSPQSLQALVGRTFRRDGLERTVTRVEGRDVYWRRPNSPTEQKRPMWGPYFCEWLGQAEEVTP